MARPRTGSKSSAADEAGATAAGGWAIADCTGLGCSRRATAARQSSGTSERKGRRHQASFTAGDIPGPILHDHDTPVEEIPSGHRPPRPWSRRRGQDRPRQPSRATPVSPHQSRNEERNPWGTAGICRSRNSCESAASCKGRPTWAGKTNDEPGEWVRDCSSTPSAAPDSGTRCSTGTFIRSAGTVHVDAARSNSAQEAPRTSPERAAVRIRNSSARRTAA